MKQLKLMFVQLSMMALAGSYVIASYPVEPEAHSTVFLYEDMQEHILERGIALEERLLKCLSDIYDNEEATVHSILLPWMEIKNSVMAHRNQINCFQAKNMSSRMMRNNERLAELLAQGSEHLVIRRKLSDCIVNLTARRLGHLLDKYVSLISDRPDTMDANSGWTYHGTLDRNGANVKVYTDKDFERDL